MFEFHEVTIMMINPVVYDGNKGNDIFSSNLESRIIHLVGEVNDAMAASVIAQLLHLEAQGTEDIYLYINSPGGSVSAGMAIYDTMQYISSDVATVCTGMAASMGAVILSGGTKGKRAILPHSEVMIHQPSSGVSGQATDILLVANHIEKTRATLNQVLSENCDKDLEQVAKDTERDYWMNSKEALEYGIVDKILDKKNKES